MFIKSIELRGFKTYKDLTRIDFDPRVNCIVGLNGSGKSNLLTAVAFMIADVQGVGLDKKAFLHEGASTAVLSASVRLILDNSDRRLLTYEKDEITLERRIRSVKDEYVIDSKNVSKSDYMAILESAGFCKSNPYYVVRQGKISELTMMNDESRLRLLKEIAGTKLFDERRAEALKTLEDTRSKKVTIFRLLESIESRLGELQAEQTELFRWQTLDLRDRCWRYAKAQKAQISAVDDKKQYANESSEASKAIFELRETIQNLDCQRLDREEKISDCELHLTSLNKTLEHVRHKVKEDEKQHTKMELELQEKKRMIQDSLKKKEVIEKQIVNLNKEIEKVEGLIKASAPELIAAAQKKNQATSAKVVCEQELYHLMSKQERNAKFKTIKQRNTHLDKEIKGCEGRLQMLSTEAQQLGRQIADIANKENYAVTKEQLEASRKEVQSQLEQVKEELGRLRVSTEEKENRLRQLQGRGVTLQSQRENLEQEQSRARREKNSTMKEAQIRAHEAVRRWAVNNGQETEILGTLLENIEVQEGLETAVDTAAGGQLHNLLVTNAATAKMVMKAIREGSHGFATISPLAELASRERLLRSTQHRPQHDSRAVLLTDYIKCSEIVRPAVNQVFGRFLVVDSVEVGNEIVKFGGFDAITASGDVVTRKGVLTGGYLAPASMNKITKQNRYRAISSHLETVRSEHMEAFQEEERLRNEITELASKRTNAQIHRQELQSRETELQREAQRLSSEWERTGRSQEDLQKRMEATAVESKEITEQIHTLRREMMSSTLGSLSSEEVSRLEILQESLPKLRKNEAKLLEDFTAKESSIGRLRTRLQDELKPRLRAEEEEMQEQRQGGAGSIDTGDFAEEDIAQMEAENRALRADIDEQTQQKEKLVQDVAETQNKYQNYQKEMQKQEKNLSQHRKKLTELESEVAVFAKRIDQAVQREEEARANIVAAPTDDEAKEIIERFMKMSDERLAKEAVEISAEIDSFRGVNKKAIDQFTNFSREIQQHRAKRDEILKGEEAVMELIELLDSKKESSLLKTFENVNKNFDDIFKKIVHGGTAKLVLKRMTDDELADVVAERQRKAAAKASKAAANSQASETQLSVQFATKDTFTETIEAYTGVGCRVSFRGGEDAVVSMRQLSGGQKTVVAVALIFAIQRCDPGPFYLFDELDAALDDQYRGSVARLVSESSEHTQFILTTFRRQLIGVGNKFVKVTMHNKCSLVSNVTQEQARNVVEETQALEA